MRVTVVHPDGSTEVFDDPGDVPPPVRTISVRAYMRLFTMPELLAIEVAAETDAAIRVFLRLLYAGSEVNLDAPEVAAALAHLVTVSAISAGRPAEILA